MREAVAGEDFHIVLVCMSIDAIARLDMDLGSAKCNTPAYAAAKISGECVNTMAECSTQKALSFTQFATNHSVCAAWGVMVIRV